ncbi:hypothetical protein [uncultured Jannaschia sp.]|uniref:RcgA family putative transporter n=1 Tax=uncultured Jannaschia sp. TaxID=293347 RepID=UPI00260D0190|nr:hypothetical protein [uncultured Jannaschia sp.]
MIKNGKYFVPPGDGEHDFKALFKRTVSAGAGRPVDSEGFPQGSWTPDALAEAISQLEANRAGIELRTVQLWFQDNEKGISADNIRWLARVFGCDDPEATSAWQAELSASQARLTAKRRQMRRHKDDEQIVPQQWDTDQPVVLETVESSDPTTAEGQTAETTVERTSLARASEALFSQGSPLNLPVTVFAGAVSLQFLSLFLDISSVTYTRDDGIIKQVGFLWAPNWTILFIIFLPLFLAFVVDLLVFWRREGRAELSGLGSRNELLKGWERKVGASSYTFWAAFLVNIGFAGIFQWVDIRLLPLLTGEDDHAVDWGSLALVDPDAIGVSQQIVFTGLAYFYMCICFYLFFTGLILLYTLVHDFSEIVHQRGSKVGGDPSRVSKIELRIMQGIFRCTILGLLIAITMKLQALYVTTTASNVPHWLLIDGLSLMPGVSGTIGWGDYATPTNYTSLVVALSTCTVFLYGFVRIGLSGPYRAAVVKMMVVVVLEVLAYLSMGAFSGFSVLLVLGILLATYGLFDPGFGTGQVATRGTRDVT